MANSAKVEIGACPEHGILAMRFEGPCTAIIVGAVRDALSRIVKDPVRKLYFDLTAAESVDSTFTGLLVSRAVARDTGETCSFHLTGPTKPICKALETMHVLRLFDVTERLPEVSFTWHSLELQPPEADCMADIVASAHQALIDADKRNAPIFGRVVEMFRKAGESDGQSK